MPGDAPLHGYMFDLGCIIPYYTGPLSRSLEDQHVNVRLVSIAYHFDPEYFTRSGLRPNAGILDIVGKLGIRNRSLRRVLKGAEYAANLLILAARFTARRPALVHIQYLALFEQGAPLDRWFVSYLKKLGIRLVYTVHDHLPHDTGERHKAKYAHLYSMMDALICHTAQSKEGVVQDFSIDPARISVIPHGPLFLPPGSGETRDLERKRLGLAPSSCMVLCQGFIKPYKGIPFLLDAWHRVQVSGADARLIIAGTGEPQLVGELERQVAALGIGSSVQFDSRFLSATEMGQIHEAADVLVFPFKAITMSGSLMTGVPYRKPIVATRLPAFEQILTDNETGLLVDYGDVEGFSAVLLRLIQDPELRRRLGTATALVESNCSWAEIAVATANCYKSLS